MIGITNSLFSVVSLLRAAFYNDATYDLFQGACRGGIAHFSVCSSSHRGRRTPWIAAKGRGMHLLPCQEGDRKVCTLSDGIALRRLPRDLDSR